MSKSKTLFTTALTLAGIVAVAMRLEAQRTRSGFSFTGRRVVITGGSRGLGLMLARHLVDEGAHVALLARDGAELDRARADLEARGARQVVTQVCDVRDEAAVTSAIEFAAREMGAIDVLIHCAGVITVGPAQHMSKADYQESMDVHYWGAWHATHAALPHLRKSGQGRIIYIASSGGMIAVPHLGAYSNGKAALVSLGETMHAELSREGILVTTVCPTTLRTGSHVNARFKGQHAKEFDIFSLLATLPVVSQDASASAHRVIEGSRHGAPYVFIPRPVQLAPVMKGLFPTLVNDALALVNNLLPAPTRPQEGNVTLEGWDIETTVSPSTFTALGDKATVDNNELRGHAPRVVDDAALDATKDGTPASAHPNGAGPYLGAAESSMQQGVSHDATR
jgi:NAD(P)-dependent dehydrogenase (short-subunit alcohol dehydrogenase family)